MIDTHLNWYQRIMLWVRVGAVQAPNMRVASVLYRVLEKVRPNDEERGLANLRITPEGQYSWQLPDNDFGSMTAHFDGEEAEMLAGVLESPQLEFPVRVSDLAWLLPLIETLKTKPEPEPELEPVVAHKRKQ